MWLDLVLVFGSGNGAIALPAWGVIPLMAEPGRLFISVRFVCRICATFIFRRFFFSCRLMMLKHSEIGLCASWYNFFFERGGGALSAGCRLCMCWRYCFMLKLCWHVPVKFFA